ncbi:unnamed protein product [Closterium sp. NIES-64]|nr:unnamed protein product [Closterium sp. NIES-64]
MGAGGIPHRAITGWTTAASRALCHLPSARYPSYGAFAVAHVSGCGACSMMSNNYLYGPLPECIFDKCVNQINVSGISLYGRINRTFKSIVVDGDTLINLAHNFFFGNALLLATGCQVCPTQITHGRRLYWEMCQQLHCDAGSLGGGRRQGGEGECGGQLPYAECGRGVLSQRHPPTPPFVSLPSLFPEPHDPEKNLPPPRTVIVVLVPSVHGGEQHIDRLVGPAGSKAPTSGPPLGPSSSADSAPVGPEDGPFEDGGDTADHEEEGEMAVDEQPSVAHEHEPSPAASPIQPIPHPPRRFSRPNKGVTLVRFQPSAMTAHVADDEDNPYDMAYLAEDDCDTDRNDEVEYLDEDEEEEGAWGGVILDLAAALTGPEEEFVLSLHGHHSWHCGKWLGLEVRKQYTLQQMVKATNNWAKESEVGRGGFGVVYKGYSPQGQMWAIKLSTVMTNEFEREVRAMATLNHVNLVRLQGFCVDRNVETGKQEQIMV